MTKQEYIRQVTKQLQCARARKKEIQRQLDSHIEIALSEGRQLEEILAEMGDPQALAREFNENMEESEKKRAARGKILPLAAGIVLLAAALAGGWLYWAMPKGRDIHSSKIFDAGQVQSAAEEMILLFSQEDYDSLENYMSEELREALEKTPLETLRPVVGDDWGSFCNFGNIYMAEISQKGKSYAVVQLNASYDNVSVGFTLTFGEGMQLVGFYFK